MRNTSLLSSIGLMIIFGLGACENSPKPIENIWSLTYQDSVLNRLGFYHIEKMENFDCEFFLDTSFSKFYNLKETSFETFYKINDPLFKDHYSEVENNAIIKLAAFPRNDTTGEVYFFGIDLENSDFLFLNFLPEFNILTADGHFRFNTDFSILVENNCIEKIDSSAQVNRTFYENTIFESSDNFLWRVDSVFTLNENESILNAGESFTVVENSKMCFDKDTIYFSIQDYFLYLTNSSETTRMKMVSYSKNGRILMNYDDATYIFMTRSSQNPTDN